MAAEANEREQRSVPGTVKINLASSTYALVALVGEHDLSTRPELREALRRASANTQLVVDLTECSFVDSVTIGVLIATHDQLAERGGQLEIVLPPASSIVNRAFELLRVRDILSVSDSLEVAESKLPQASSRDAWLEPSPPLPVD